MQYEITLDANSKPIIKFVYNTAKNTLEEKVIDKFVTDAQNVANKIAITETEANGVTTITFSVVPV